MIGLICFLVFVAVVCYGLHCVKKTKEEIRQDAIDDIFLLNKCERAILEEELVREKFYSGGTYASEFDRYNATYNISFGSKEERDAALKIKRDRDVADYKEEFECKSSEEIRTIYVDYLIEKIGYDGLKALMKLKDKCDIIGIRGFQYD